MQYIIAIDTPNGQRAFIPDGFGFTAHEYTTNKKDAQIFFCKKKAQKYLTGYRWPSYTAFWESEHKSAAKQERDLSNYDFSVILV